MQRTEVPNTGYELIVKNMRERAMSCRVERQQLASKKWGHVTHQGHGTIQQFLHTEHPGR